MADYAEQTAATNSLGVDDALLAVAMDDRTDYIWVSDGLDITDDELDTILTEELEPRLRDGDEAAAAIAAVDGLGLAAESPTPTEGPIVPGPVTPIPSTGPDAAGGGSSGGGLQDVDHRRDPGRWWRLPRVPVVAVAARGSDGRARRATCPAGTGRVERTGAPPAGQRDVDRDRRADPRRAAGGGFR